jgi:hypothetical protein
MIIQEMNLYIPSQIPMKNQLPSSISLMKYATFHWNCIERGTHSQRYIWEKIRNLYMAYYYFEDIDNHRIMHRDA